MNRRHQPVGLLDGLLDGVDVKRTNATKVNDLGFNAFLCEFLRGFQRVGDHLAVCNNRDVTSFALNFCLADWQ